MQPKKVNAGGRRCWQDNTILAMTDEQSHRIARYRYVYRVAQKLPASPASDRKSYKIATEQRRCLCSYTRFELPALMAGRTTAGGIDGNTLSDSHA